MKKLSRKIISYILGVLLLIVLLSARAISPGTQNPHSDTTHPATEHSSEALTEYPDEHNDSHGVDKEGFDPARFIFDHILDAYEWHILTYKNFHMTIPLPVIIYSESKGLEVFMFSKFHHGHSDYHGLRFETHGENRGKIVEVLDGGNTALPALDLSFTKNVLAILISLILMLWIFISVARAYSRREGKAPAGMQNLVEPFILFIRDDIAKPSIGEEKYRQFLPYLLTIFFFILLNNLLGLVPIFPGGANITGNITVTMVLALFTFIITTINGNKNYWMHIINTPGVPWWVKFPIPLMPVIEIIGMFTKPFVLMIRLFANISAGHIIALGFFSLIFIFGQMQVALGYGVSIVSMVFNIFMFMLELLVAMIQAYVFTLLSALYFGMATVEHH